MFSIGFLTFDLLLFIVIFVLSFFWSLNRGKKIIFRFIILSYPTILVFLNFPFYQPNTAITQLGLYIFIFAFLYIFVGKVINTERLYGRGRFFDATLLSISVILILLTIYNYIILNIENLYSVNLPYVTKYFLEIPTGILYILPLLAIAMVSKRG